jgi:hypothetical protein
MATLFAIDEKPAGVAITPRDYQSEATANAIRMFEHQVDKAIEEYEGGQTNFLEADKRPPPF